VLNDAEQRLAYYRRVIAAAEQDVLEPLLPGCEFPPSLAVPTCPESCR
jgi:hypothetical protein